MYLHLGQDVLVRNADILGVYDLDKATVSKRTRTFLAEMEKAGRIVNVAVDLPKSFIVCGRGGDLRVYISQISAQTLLKRFHQKTNL